MKTAAGSKIRTLDVRPQMARGEEPFRTIMATVVVLAADESLVVIAPFLPSPLIERMQAAGYQARPERRADGAWQTLFRRE